MWRSLSLRVCLVAAATWASLAASARAEPAMWVIKDKDSTIYLLGTIHILRNDTVWNTPKIKAALFESKELWLEVVDSEGAMMSLVGKYGIDAARPLSQRLKPEQMERVVKAAESYTFPIHLLEQMKPWYAALTLTMLPMFKAGYNPNAGVESVLTVQAKIERDKVVGLETTEEQIQFMNQLPEADQIAFLMESVEDVEKGMAELEEMTKAWSEGDIDNLAAKMAEEMKRDAPSLYRTLLVERNVRWSRQVAKLLKRSGVQFIAVGAGHLVGEDSLQAQLAKRGIKAERY